jgi:hypothetical protein
VTDAVFTARRRVAIRPTEISPEVNMLQVLRSLTNHTPGFARALALAAALLLLCVAAEAVRAEGIKDPFRYRSGVRNGFGKFALSAERLGAVAASLREKTGFVELRFDEEGFLALGDRARVAGGSAAARDLVVAAVDGAKAFVLEDHHSSRQVSFAKLESAVVYQNMRTGQRMETRALLLDFSDFTNLRGERDVLAAFDVGFVVLHELAHGALGLSDAASPEDEPGDCETYINRVRRDLGLPERLRYAARHNVVSAGAELRDRRAELFFARTVKKDGKSRLEYRYLSWSMAEVGESQAPRAAETAERERAKTTAGIQ